MPFTLLFSLVLHSFLEGSILVQNGHGHGHGHTHQEASFLASSYYSVLVGIAIHHIPAAVALMSVLMFRLKSLKKAYPYLFLILSGLVVGNFLHISTTILFETSPDHRFHKNKLMATAIGALLAILGSYL